jgi:hypothetical protein
MDCCAARTDTWLLHVSPPRVAVPVVITPLQRWYPAHGSPTALQKSMDCSQRVHVSGRRVPIRDSPSRLPLGFVIACA